MTRLLITIDGPAGAGKTTVSRQLADALGYRYVDTGALYRAVAVEVRRAGLADDDDAGLAALLDRLDLHVQALPDGTHLVVNGVDVTSRLRDPDITMLASAVSARTVVRRHLLQIQRRLGAEKGAVFEGRDMGTVVFPDADVKFFLDAAPAVRARRRYLELASDRSITLGAVERDMRRRDQNDSKRDVAPLTPAADAIIIDATDLTLESVVARMMKEIRKQR